MKKGKRKVIHNLRGKEEEILKKKILLEVAFQKTVPSKRLIHLFLIKK